MGRFPVLCKPQIWSRCAPYTTPGDPCPICHSGTPARQIIGTEAILCLQVFPTPCRPRFTWHHLLSASTSPRFRSAPRPRSSLRSALTPPRLRTVANPAGIRVCVYTQLARLIVHEEAFPIGAAHTRRTGGQPQDTMAESTGWRSCTPRSRPSCATRHLCYTQSTPSYKLLSEYNLLLTQRLASYPLGVLWLLCVAGTSFAPSTAQLSCPPLSLPTQLSESKAASYIDNPAAITL
jgi:hypothetical protein